MVYAAEVLPIIAPDAAPGGAEQPAPVGTPTVTTDSADQKGEL
jgi:hypothetical protein